jgi:hypothetical protein
LADRLFGLLQGLIYTGVYRVARLIAQPVKQRLQVRRCRAHRINVSGIHYDIQTSGYIPAYITGVRHTFVVYVTDLVVTPPGRIACGLFHIIAGACVSPCRESGKQAEEKCRCKIPQRTTAGMAFNPESGISVAKKSEVLQTTIHGYILKGYEVINTVSNFRA